jgi:neutral amino acid transport system ATP-binding protein
MMLEFKNISAAYYKGHPILDGVNQTFAESEKYALLGRNGAGKTTFAKTIFGLVPIISGDIYYRGIKISGLPLEKIARLGIGYFMQGAPVFPQLSVRENILITAGKVHGQTFAGSYATLREVFPLLQQKSVDHVSAGSLSGGERTQLALAMAVFHQPSFLIMDEPFAGLSPANVQLILNTLLGYHENTGASMLLIAQDRQLASAFCSKHYLIRDGKFTPSDLC